VLTWNASNLTWGGHESALLVLLETTGADIIIVSEAELPRHYIDAGFNINGYVTFFPLMGLDMNTKARVIALTKTELSPHIKLRTDLMSASMQSLWIEAALPSGKVLFGGFYRTWSRLNNRSASDDLAVIISQFGRAASEAKRVVILGDFNLDLFRLQDSGYQHRALLQSLVEAASNLCLELHTTDYTYRSNGEYVLPDGSRGQRHSRIDHVYSAGVDARVAALPNSATDHRPLLVTVAASTASGTPLGVIKRRNFKALRRPDLEQALHMTDWSPIFESMSADFIASFIVTAITTALDLVCPHKAIKVRKDNCLYLSDETRKLMTARDKAKGSQYKRLRNRVCSLVKRDRIRSNLSRLRDRPEDQRLLWQMASRSLGKATASLPASIMSPSGAVSGAEAASTMNEFYVKKVLRLRQSIPTKIGGTQFRGLNCSSSPVAAVRDENRFFDFKFANAGRVAKVISRLKCTEAVGFDGIPVRVLKLGADVLASPIARLVNVSLSTGIVPKDFKTALVLPIHKGKGKSLLDPASYRPIALLPTLSKILEIIVRDDLEAHLDSVDALPDTQFGFRPERSTSMAVAAAQASWLEAREAGMAVGILAFDLTAAFDTVNQEQLLPKLQGFGVRGNALKWFRDYLSGGRQAVIWDSATSGLADLEYGIRQGSCLSPLLFLILVSDMTAALGTSAITGYADDTCVWSSSSDLESLRADLEAKADRFADYVASCGLVLNADKTQLLLAGKKDPNFAVIVNGSRVTPGDNLELLGVQFARDLSTRPQQAKLAASLRQRASLIARLAHHLPRGPLLRQLAHGLVLGKANHAVTSLVRPRLDREQDAHNADLRAAQVALNDVARTITGKKREDHIKIDKLLHDAGIPSLNQVSVKSTAMETWKAFHSRDGGDAERNLLGKAIFGSNKIIHDGGARSTRSKASGEIPVPNRTKDNMVYSAAKLWNECPLLRAATTKCEALAIAKKISREAP
jgi:hypothetical protein